MFCHILFFNGLFVCRELIRGKIGSNERIIEEVIRREVYKVEMQKWY